MYGSSLTALTLTLVLGALSSTANAITIDGVVLDNSGGNNLFSGVVFEFTVSGAGDELTGHFEVDVIRGGGGGVVWTSGDNGVELTGVFHSYIVDSINPSHIEFTGGVMEIYSDAAENFDPADPSKSNDGNLWATFAGHPSLTGITLAGNANMGDFLTATFQGFVGGLLDIAGPGLASNVLDTNGLDDGADAIFGTSFNTALANDVFPVGGSFDVVGRPLVSIPEPFTFALAALSLISLGMTRRRRRR